MSRSRFVRPETCRLDLTDGDWLLVKRRLTHGEENAMFARQTMVAENGSVRLNPLTVSDAKVLAYLVDWSITDLDGRPSVIRSQPLDVVEAAVWNLDPEDYAEIKAAIDAHETAQLAAREAEKKTPGGETLSPPTSPLRVAVAGATSG